MKLKLSVGNYHLAEATLHKYFYSTAAQGTMHHLDFYALKDLLNKMHDKLFSLTENYSHDTEIYLQVSSKQHEALQRFYDANKAYMNRNERDIIFIRILQQLYELPEYDNTIRTRN